MGRDKSIAIVEKILIELLVLTYILFFEVNLISAVHMMVMGNRVR